VRGHRIELGEIEVALEARADTAEAVVVVQGEGEDAELVAHLVAEGIPETAIESFARRIALATAERSPGSIASSTSTLAISSSTT
jgi:acyl-coenzyme A synthetase/AMP-(fatty) acid ligase